MLTAGESHGKALVAVLEGLPAGVPVSPKELSVELARRRHGYGRGGRQKFETDLFELLGGVRHGRTLGSPIAVTIPNLEWDAKYSEIMGVEGEGVASERLTRPRPGHADLGRGYVQQPRQPRLAPWQRIRRRRQYFGPAHECWR